MDCCFRSYAAWMPVSSDPIIFKESIMLLVKFDFVHRICEHKADLYI